MEPDSQEKDTTSNGVQATCAAGDAAGCTQGKGEGDDVLLLKLYKVQGFSSCIEEQCLTYNGCSLWHSYDDVSSCISF